MADDTLFPASEQTPGQSASRAAWAEIQGALRTFEWWSEFEELRALGLDWRKAVAVAWRASRGLNRLPATQAELASMMGLKSDRTLRKWFEDQPDLEDLVAAFQAGPLLKHRRDVIEALVVSASNVEATHASDRKLFFQLTGDLEEKSQQRLVGPEDGPIIILPAKRQEEPAQDAGAAGRATADVPGEHG
jgi:hypothetical protein